LGRLAANRESLDMQADAVVDAAVAKLLSRSVHAPWLRQR
jgi:hypothetical protein